MRAAWIAILIRQQMAPTANWPCMPAASVILARKANRARACIRTNARLSLLLEGPDACEQCHEPLALASKGRRGRLFARRGGEVVSKPRILVLGAGGTGVYFGGRLAESGADVTFLVREGRRKLLREQGLRIESPFGDAQMAVKTVVGPEVAPIYDAVILTCKAYDLDAAITAIAPAVAPTGYVLPFLNGVAHIDDLNEKFGRHRVLGGTAKIQATIAPDGTIRQFNDWRTLTIGEQSGEMTERVRTLAA